VRKSRYFSYTRTVGRKLDEHHANRKLMKYNKETIERAHLNSSLHKAEIMKSEICGCFYCLKTSKPDEILDWIDNDNPNGETALCPNCGIDSLIGSTSGFPVDNKDFLKAMNKFWF